MSIFALFTCHGGPATWVIGAKRFFVEGEGGQKRASYTFEFRNLAALTGIFFFVCLFVFGVFFAFFGFLCVHKHKVPVLDQ